jgi:E3 ubiquitin-protein ligase RNF115/126
MEHLSNSLDTDHDVYLNSSCPPASSDVIQNLPCIQVSEEDLGEECNRECCICFYEHKVGDVQVARLPCGHLFHQNCIRDWLTKKCTCPICRYELPSDNEVFEQGRVERMKSRKLRVRSHELERMSVQELQEMVDTTEVEDRSELMKMLHDSDRVEILESSLLPLSSTALQVGSLESSSDGAMDGLNPQSGGDDRGGDSVGTS